LKRALTASMMWCNCSCSNECDKSSILNRIQPKTTKLVFVVSLKKTTSRYSKDWLARN